MEDMISQPYGRENKQKMFNVHWEKNYIFGEITILKDYNNLQGYIQNLFGTISEICKQSSQIGR